MLCEDEENKPTPNRLFVHTDVHNVQVLIVSGQKKKSVANQTAAAAPINPRRVSHLSTKLGHECEFIVFTTTVNPGQET